MFSRDIERRVLALVADAKGILAADETIPTLTRRFDALGIKSTEQSRCTYREMLFTSSGAAELASAHLNAQPASWLEALENHLRTHAQQSALEAWQGRH